MISFQDIRTLTTDVQHLYPIHMILMLHYEIQHCWERLQQWWERVAVRKWINDNPRMIIGITCASVFVLLTIIVGISIPEKAVKVQEVGKDWFYDLNTGKLFVAKSGEIPPLEAPSGPLPNGQPAGVRAYVFSFSYEPNESNRFIGFLEIHDPNAEKQRPKSAKSTARGAERWGQGRLIRRVNDKQWYPANSSEGQRILEELFTPNKQGQTANYCPPN